MRVTELAKYFFLTVDNLQCIRVAELVMYRRVSRGGGPKGPGPPPSLEIKKQKKRGMHLSKY